MIRKRTNPYLVFTLQGFIFLLLLAVAIVMWAGFFYRITYTTVWSGTEWFLLLGYSGVTLLAGILARRWE